MGKIHLATGNYNDKTARQYADVGLMSCDPDLTADAAAFFNLLTGYSQTVGWRKFWIAPTDLRRRFMLEGMQRCGGVQTRAAELLGMTFRSFRYFAKKYSLNRSEAGGGGNGGRGEEAEVEAGQEPEVITEAKADEGGAAEGDEKTGEES